GCSLELESMPSRMLARSASRPLRAWAKIQSGTHPLGECTCSFIPNARSGLQHMVGDFVQEGVFVFLVAGHVLHGIDPHVHGWILTFERHRSLTIPMNFFMAHPSVVLDDGCSHRLSLIVCFRAD